MAKFVPITTKDGKSYDINPNSVSCIWKPNENSGWMVYLDGGDVFELDEPNYKKLVA